ncbi:GNAT family N-acetyltransferase [Paucibacter soli]|uniref:GNAT family N-acetyltransferase n=1 Tax=Paucibacter soli TaxID=3133433 RepID=UPI0030AE0F06
MNTFALRPATAADLPFLLRLRQQTMQDHLLAAGIELSPQQHLERVLYRFDVAQLLMVGGAAAGLLKLARDAEPWELLQIQIAPDFQGRGLGRQLIEQVIAEARRARASIRLGVLKHNPAKRLYDSLGFVVLATDEREFQMLFRP